MKYFRKACRLLKNENPYLIRRGLFIKVHSCHRPAVIMSLFNFLLTERMV